MIRGRERVSEGEVAASALVSTWLPAHPAGFVTVSGSTGSPAETTDGDYKVWTFNSSGSLTFSAGGQITYLVVGGGGAGGASFGGGGGGGDVQSGSVYMPHGTKTITIGGGGPGVSYSEGGSGGSSLLDDG